mmetsp:Transcript_47802/g.86132  ORF Transcript_47802/g.86132 Transcript_47802/m.86132 type:complete len:592 (-) Transcript_47802:71-1846(-)
MPGNRLSNAGRVHGNGGKLVSGPQEFGVSSELPALSVCRLEAREELLKKLRQHVDDPALAEFTCPICWEPFWQPVRTVCGHAFCEGCLLKSVLAQLGQPQPDVSCPLCRHPLHVDDVTADQALLTKIRLVVAAKEGENWRDRGTGRICRGLVRASTPGTAGPSTAGPSSLGASRPGWRDASGSRPGTSYESGASHARGNDEGQPLRCTGRPFTPMTAPTGSQMGSLDLSPSDGMPSGPLLGGWMRVAPVPGARPPTSGSLPRRGSDRGTVAVRPQTVATAGTGRATSSHGTSPALPTGSFLQSEDEYSASSEAASIIPVVDWRKSSPAADNVWVLDDVEAEALAESDQMDEAALRWSMSFSSGSTSLPVSTPSAEDDFPGWASVSNHSMRLPGLLTGAAAIPVIPEAEAAALSVSAAAVLSETTTSASPRLSNLRPSTNRPATGDVIQNYAGNAAEMLRDSRVTSTGSRSSRSGQVQLQLPQSSQSLTSPRAPKGLSARAPKARLGGSIRQPPNSGRVLRSSNGGMSSESGRAPGTAPAVPSLRRPSAASASASSSRPTGVANIAALSSASPASYEADFAFAHRYRKLLAD